jgi:hypothetical protein
LIGGLGGAATAIDGRLLNPKALLIAGSVVAAYKTIETVVGAFGKEDNGFDKAVDSIFKSVAGWTALAATGYATRQTLLDNSYWFAGSTLVFCFVFAILGASSAEVPSTTGQHDPSDATTGSP